MPQFVEREFREFLLCGVYEAGVARFQCEGCEREHLVPFSCYPQRETICSCQFGVGWRAAGIRFVVGLMKWINPRCISGGRLDQTTHAGDR